MSRILKNFLFYFAFPILAITLFAGALGSQRMAASYRAKMLESAKEANKFTQKVLDDLKIIDSADIFGHLSFTRNAESTISKHVEWLSNTNEKMPLAKVILERHPDWGKSKEAYEALTRDSDLKSIDVEWISQLKDFDYIDLSTNERISKMLARIPDMGPIDRVQVHSTLPLLNFNDLENQVTIYAIKKAQGSETDKTIALQSLHHVASLLISTSSLVAQMAAVSSLRREVFLTDKFNIKTNSKLNNDLVDRMRRVGMAWPGIVQSLILGLGSKEFEAYLKPELMVCGSASEISFPLMIGEYLEPQWPLEPSFKTEMMAHKQVYQKLFKDCHSDTSEVYLKYPDKSKPTSISAIFFGLPYARRMISFLVMSISFPNFFRGYSNLETK